MKVKKIVTASLATTTLLGIIGLSNFASAYSEDVWFDSYGIDVYDGDPLDSVTDVFGYTRGEGDVKSVKVYYEVFRDGEYLDKASNSRNGFRVSITEDHPNKKRSSNWEVNAVHRIEDNNGDYAKEFSEDKLKKGEEAFAPESAEESSSKKGDIQHLRSTEYQEQLENTWDDIMEAHNLNKDEWIVCDSSQYESLKEQPPGSLTSRDVTSLFIQSVEFPKKGGDSVPLILVHENEKKALLLLQRAKGEKVVVYFGKEDSSKNNKNNKASSNREKDGEGDWVVEKVEEKE
ncbi:hypothetical protein A616_17515 [Brevibacillus brevis X23]|nr:hypothetical protein A616_17515 [Brevibacillus brevis X23]